MADKAAKEERKAAAALEKEKRKLAAAARKAAGGGEEEGASTVTDASGATDATGASALSGGAAKVAGAAAAASARAAARSQAAAAAEAAVAASSSSATGILVSEKRSRDVKIASFSLSLHGRLIVEDTTLELTWGQRYGLIGMSGCGKSTMLKCIAARDVPIPEHIDTYFLDREAPPCEFTALEYVIDSAQKELSRLEALAEALLVELGPDSDAYLDAVDRQGELDPSTFVSRASSILVGLGFSPVPIKDGSYIDKKCKDMSGGWRMRVALARALFVSPSLLLLDEPTNHLDLEACVWLEDYLSKYPKILVIVSHSQDFLNGVCTTMMVMQQRKLRYWGGNYDMYCKTRAEQDLNQMTQFKKQQAEIADIKAFIASCGTYANLVRQAKSREKQLNKMIEDGLLTAPYVDPVFRFNFPETSKMAPPLISFADVAFAYSGKKEDYLFKQLRFGIDSDSRIALVGPNGAGKSTLLKLMVGENAPSEGNVALRSGMSIGRYHQHSAEVLDLEATPLAYISSKFHDRYPERKPEDWRSVIGTYGLESHFHNLPIKYLSEGLKTRLIFAEISLLQPHILLMDEPTNAADMEMIDSMAMAINKFQGGVVVISHDFRLLEVVAKEIWIVDKGIKIWDGDIRSYKTWIRKQVAAGKAGGTGR